MAVAAMATMPAPAYLSMGMAAITATAMHDQMGVRSVGCTLAKWRESGSRLSRAMPKQRRTVAAMMAMQQTKIAAETTSRYTVAQNLSKLASMICAGPQPSLIAVPRFGIAIKSATRKIPPMTKAPDTESKTACGPRRRGSWVFQSSLEAVLNP